jgi:hypothetical protein
LFTVQITSQIPVLPVTTTQPDGIIVDSTDNNSKNSNIGLIVGLCVGLGEPFIIVPVALACYIGLMKYRKHRKSPGKYQYYYFCHYTQRSLVYNIAPHNFGIAVGTACPSAVERKI